LGVGRVVGGGGRSVWRGANHGNLKIDIRIDYNIYGISITAIKGWIIIQ
jgi:hypothetical protein